MTTVTVQDGQGTISKVLDADQTRLFLQEFTRVRRFWAPDRDLNALIAPDCTIEVDDNGRTRKYEIQSRAVLVDRGRKRKYQFYFGLLLLEWLQSP